MSEPGDDVPEASPFVLHSPSSKPRGLSECLEKIIFLELGSFHGNLEPQVFDGKLSSGASYITTKINEIREKNRGEMVVVVSTGDFFTGPVLAQDLDGKPVIDFFNRARFDLMVLGHHDFDKGQEILRHRLLEAQFPVVVSNMVCEKQGVHISQSQHPLSMVRPHLYLQRGAVTILVVGLMKHSTANFQVREHIQGLKWISARSTLKKIIQDDEFARRMPQIIVVYYKNIVQAKSLIWYVNTQMKKARVERLPLIVSIGGESPGYGPIQEWNYAILPGTARGHQIGKVEVDLRRTKEVECKVEFVNIVPGLIKPDPDLENMLALYKAQLPIENQELIGYCVRRLTKKKDVDCPLGNLVTEAMLKAANADVAFVSSGTLKQEIQCGSITLADIKAAVPFADRVFLIDITGSKIVQVLEQCARLEADSGSGGKLLQVAGLRMTYDVRRSKGDRLVASSINSKPIDPAAEYRAAVSEFLVKGGDCFDEFKECQLIMDIGTLHEIISAFVKTTLEGKVDITRDNRITKLG